MISQKISDKKVNPKYLSFYGCVYKMLYKVADFGRNH